MYKIIDNVVDLQTQNIIKDYFLSGECSWYFNRFSAFKNKYSEVDQEMVKNMMSFRHPVLQNNKSDHSIINPCIDIIKSINGNNVFNIITQFYQEVFNDVMIGYLFLGQDRQRLIEREIEFSARMLGATDIPYQGQPLTKAHQKHPIRYGHFHRRNQVDAFFLSLQ